MKIKSMFFVTALIFLSAMFLPHAICAEIKVPEYLNGKTLCEYGDIKVNETTGKSVSIYNMESGFSIYEKNPEIKVYPASTVKVMTAIVAYENIPDKSVPITITRSVVNESIGLKLGLEIGDTYTAGDLIRAVLICGSNDAANQLAEYVSGGNEAKFIQMMNDKAAEIGCTSTNFTNPTGLHNPEMYTTAADLMKIAIYAYSIDDIADWSSAASYTFSPLENPDNYKLRYNRNDFISRSNRWTYYYKNAFGLNSGYTPEAGNCLITAASQNGMTYICVIMNSPADEDNETNHAYLDAKMLLDFCFSNFTMKQIVNTESVISEVPLKLSANKDHVLLYPANSIKHILPVNIGVDDLSFEKVIYSQVYNAPVTKGDKFGELIIKYKEDYILGKTHLISNENFERSAVLYAIDKIREFVTSSFFIVSVITAVILLIAYTVLSIKNKYNRHWFK